MRLFRAHVNRCWSLTAVLLASCVTLILLPPLSGRHRATAADDLSQTALAIAPQDVSFLSTSVNLSEAWTDLAESEFVSCVRTVPFVQQLEAEFNRQWENPQGPLAQAKGALNNPNVKALLDLLRDMFDEEVFVYGSVEWSSALEGITGLQNEMTTRMSAGPEALQAYFQELSKEDIEQISIPSTVLGFRLTDPDAARLQLDALEGVLRVGGQQIPQATPLLEKLKRTDFSDGQTLTLTLDTSLIPMDQIQDEDSRAAAEKISELLEGRSLTFGLGIKGDLLIMAVGESAEVVEEVGASEQKLIDHEAIQPLKEESPDALRSISFVSTRLKEANWDANLGQYFQRLTAQFNMAVASEQDELPSDISAWQQELEEDAAWMDAQLNELKPEFGPTLSWSRAIDNGTEGYTYDWTETALENAAPLSVTAYAGSNPLLLVALKQREIPALEELADEILERAPEHVERFVQLVEEDEEERERVLAVLEKVWPIVKDGAEICRSKLGPALKGDETLIAMAAGWTTSTLGPDVPPPDRALPLPEFAIACTLADREQFISGCADLYALADRIVELIREEDPGAIPPDYSVPRPEEAERGDATKYFYSEFSQAVPLDGFEPQVVVGDEMLLLGYSERQVKEMLDAHPLEVGPAWLTDETPVALISYVDMAGMVDAFRPWLSYALSQTGRALDEPLSDRPGPIPTGNDLLQIWDCFRTAGVAAATVTVDESGGPNVSRWVWVGE